MDLYPGEGSTFIRIHLKNSYFQCVRGNVTPAICEQFVKNSSLFQYATVEVDGQKFMSPENLVRDYLGMQQVDEYNETTLHLLAGVVDQTKDG